MTADPPDTPPRPRRPRARRIALAALLLVVVGLFLMPEGRLACAEPYIPPERSPDGAWTLTLCPRPMIFAMPGGSSDAPGWLVLRDRHGAIRGVAELEMLQLYGAAAGAETEWRAGRVSRTFVVDLPLVEASGPVDRWLVDRLWRLRAMIGLTSSSDKLR